MALTRVVVFGSGPHPAERLPMSETARRGWDVVSSLLDAGHEVCFVATRPTDLYPPDLPPVLIQTKGNLSYYSITSDIDPAALDPLVPGYGGDCVVSISVPAAALATRVVGYLPHWADLNVGEVPPLQPSAADGDLTGGLKVTDESRALGADVFSCVDTRQRDELLARLAALGRVDQHAAGYQFVHLIPLAASDVSSPSTASNEDASVDVIAAEHLFSTQATDLLAWVNFPLHAPDWVAPAAVTAPTAPVAGTSIELRVARKLWRLSKRASSTLGLLETQERLAAAIKTRMGRG